MDSNGRTESAAGSSSSSLRLRTKLLIGAGHQRHVFDSAISSLDVRLTAGSLQVIGTDDPDIAVEVTTKGGLRDPKHSERVDGDELVLRSSCPLLLLTPTCSVDYVVYLPRGLDIVAHGNGSTITIETIVGNVDASTNGGTVDIRFAEAPRYVKGRSNGGRVTVEVPRGDEFYRVDADSDAGKATVDVRTDAASDRQIDLHANGGKVEVRYAA